MRRLTGRVPDSADDLGALGVNHIDTAALGCSSPRSANELVNSSLTPYRTTWWSPPLCFLRSCNGAAGLRARHDCVPLSNG